MKLVVMTDASMEVVKEMLHCAVRDNKEIEVFDVGACSPEAEERIVEDRLGIFETSSKSLLIIKFSGRESLYKEVGDTSSLLVCYMASNHQSRFASSDLIGDFKKLESMTSTYIPKEVS